MDGIELIVVSPLQAAVRSNKALLLTRKFVDGMAMYRELWKGPLTLLCEPTKDASDNLDNIEIDSDSAPFKIVCQEFSSDLFKRLFNEKSLVLVSAGEKFNAVSRVSRQMGVPCVYITEYSLRTRLQIIREYQRNFAHGLWCAGRQLIQEYEQVKAISLADGVQCNGTPTHSRYKSLTRFPFLFFDTRVEESMLSSAEKIRARSAELGVGRPLHLVFSGRLKLMKGVNDLPLVASHLRNLGVPFKLSICGDGECAPELQKEIGERGLGDHVDLRGVLEFNNELVPFISNETDLFVCCPRQGDPSCTYWETMACGVPIVGYNNEALEGLTLFSKVGWTVSSGQPKEIAEKIAVLYREPKILAAEARRSLEFATQHTFEKTFARRIEHLNAVWIQNRRLAHG